MTNDYAQRLIKIALENRILLARSPVPRERDQTQRRATLALDTLAMEGVVSELNQARAALLLERDECDRLRRILAAQGEPLGHVGQ